MRQYFIRFSNGKDVKVLAAKSREDLKRKYPSCLIYCYKETGNPVTVDCDEKGDMIAKRRVIPNMENNNYCIWRV